MADLNVQPKKNNKSILPWILLALGIIALIIFLARGCNDDNTISDPDNTTDTTTQSNSGAGTGRSDTTR
jgi:hypothetical protein